jgi:hypothetical protein
MIDDIESLADLLLANFVTVHFARNEPLWRLPDDDLPPGTRFRCLERAIWGETLSVGCYRMVIRLGLWDHGYDRFLDRVEGIGDEGWRIHLFLADGAAIGLLPQITNGAVGPGDPINLEPRRFVEWRLRSISKHHQRTGRWNWQDDDLP